MNNFCIVAQGGGMVTAYHVGVIKALKERFGFKGLNRILASSGAAATYSYLVSGQENLIQGLLPNGLFDEKFDISSKIFKINFDVYLKGKRKNFFGNFTERANFWQK